MNQKPLKAGKEHISIQSSQRTARHQNGDAIVELKSTTGLCKEGSVCGVESGGLLWSRGCWGAGEPQLVRGVEADPRDLLTHLHATHRPPTFS